MEKEFYKFTVHLPPEKEPQIDPTYLDEENLNEALEINVRNESLLVHYMDKDSTIFYPVFPNPYIDAFIENYPSIFYKHLQDKYELMYLYIIKNRYKKEYNAFNVDYIHNPELYGRDLPSCIIATSDSFKTFKKNNFIKLNFIRDIYQPLFGNKIDFEFDVSMMEKSQSLINLFDYGVSMLPCVCKKNEKDKFFRFIVTNQFLFLIKSLSYYEEFDHYLIFLLIKEFIKTTLMTSFDIRFNDFDLSYTFRKTSNFESYINYTNEIINKVFDEFDAMHCFRLSDIKFLQEKDNSTQEMKTLLAFRRLEFVSYIIALMSMEESNYFIKNKIDSKRFEYIVFCNDIFNPYIGGDDYSVLNDSIPPDIFHIKRYQLNIFFNIIADIKDDFYSKDYVENYFYPLLNIKIEEEINGVRGAEFNFKQENI